MPRHSLKQPDAPAIKLLTDQRVAHLATVSADGMPHVAPVVYVYTGTHCYIALDDKPKRVAPLQLQRVRNIQANPRVSLLVDRYDEEWSKLAWVRVDGVARILQSGRRHAQAIERLRYKYPQYRRLKIENRPVIEITVERIVQWQAKSFPVRRV